MQKVVYRPNEIVDISNRMQLSVKSFEREEPVEEEATVVQYEGPSPEELRQEAEAFRAQAEEEKKQIIEAASNEATQMTADAQAAAEKIINEASEKAAQTTTDAQQQADETLNAAKSEAEKIVADANAQRDEIFEKARSDATEAGRKEGYDEGFDEAKRLIARVHTIVEKIADERDAVLTEAENQVVALVLQIARKVVKTISESQREVVIENIVEALKKIKRPGDVTVRVNLADLQMATDHKAEFLALLESGHNLTVIEDTTVDEGGCIVDASFGSIDARISSQMALLERSILELSPMKSKRRITEKTSKPETTEDKVAQMVDSAIDAQKND